MSSLSNTGCLGRVGGEGIRVLSSGNSGSRVTSPGEQSEDRINKMSFHMHCVKSCNLTDVICPHLHTLSSQCLVGFTDLGFIGKSNSPAVQHFYNLHLHLLRRTVAHVLETRGDHKED